MSLYHCFFLWSEFFKLTLKFKAYLKTITLKHRFLLTCWKCYSLLKKNLNTPEKHNANDQNVIGRFLEGHLGSRKKIRTFYKATSFLLMKGGGNPYLLTFLRQRENSHFLLPNAADRTLTKGARRACAGCVGTSTSCSQELLWSPEKLLLKESKRPIRGLVDHIRIWNAPFLLWWTEGLFFLTRTSNSLQGSLRKMYSPELGFSRVDEAMVF